MGRIVAMALIAFLGVTIARALQARKEAKPTLEEASSNFESADIEPLFSRIGKLLDSGLGKKEVGRIRTLVNSMKLDDEKELRFSVQYRGGKTTLVVRVFLDDIDSPDIAVFAIRPLTQAIQAEMNSFQDERGR